MYKLPFKTGLTALTMAALCSWMSTSVFGSIIDLTTAGSSDSIGIATFQQIDAHPTGTGYIDSFLRIQANGDEGAYNTSGNLSSPFDQLGGSQYNRDLLLSSIPIVDGSYRFLLDINQQSSGGNALLSLNQLQVFLTSTPGQTGGSISANGYLSGLLNAQVVYDMNPGGGTANGVKLNYALNPGSGWGDIYVDIPVSAFAGKSGDYLVLYSQFGHPPGEYASNDGFEEWAVVPEPSTMVAGALLLLPMGISLIRSLRRSNLA